MIYVAVAILTVLGWDEAPFKTQLSCEPHHGIVLCTLRRFKHELDEEGLTEEELEEGSLPGRGLPLPDSFRSIAPTVLTGRQAMLNVVRTCHSMHACMQWGTFHPPPSACI